MRLNYPCANLRAEFETLSCVVLSQFLLLWLLHISPLSVGYFNKIVNLHHSIVLSLSILVVTEAWKERITVTQSRRFPFRYSKASLLRDGCCLSGVMHSQLFLTFFNLFAEMLCPRHYHIDEKKHERITVVGIVSICNACTQKYRCKNIYVCVPIDVQVLSEGW